MAIAMSLSKPLISLGVFGRAIIGYFILYFNSVYHVIEFTSNPWLHLTFAIIIASAIGMILPSDNTVESIKLAPMESDPAIITSSNIDDYGEIIISQNGVYGLQKDEN